jgi:PAS domain S-box-containing protein
VQSPAPSLEQLKVSTQPSWLWDGGRARIVWANAAGVALFGGETLFDLIDRPFDKRDRDVARVAELVTSLSAGDRHTATFEFASAVASPAALTCQCSLHALPDGRSGLLVVAERIEELTTAPDSGLMTDILGAMPIAIVVCDAGGDVVYSNAAADEMLPRAARAQLATVTGSASDAEAILERLPTAGTLGLVRKLQTTYGERDVRLTCRQLEDADGGPAKVLVMLEDVTDRRALERQLSAGDIAVASTAEPQEATSRAEQASEAGSDTAMQMAALSQAISEHSDLPAPEPAADSDAMPDLPDVPDIVERALNRIDEAIVLHRAGKFYFANNAALRLLGYDSLGRMAAAPDLIDALTGSPDRSGDVQIMHAHGEKLSLTVSHDKFPWHDGPVVQSTLKPLAVADASERDDATRAEPEVQQPTAVAEETPAKTEERKTVTRLAALPGDPELRAILDTSSDGIVTLSDDGTIISFSAGAEALFGYRLADVAGKPLADLLAGSSRKTLRDYLSALSDGGLASVFNDGREVTGVVSQGGEISLFMTIARLGDASDAEFCAVLRDITQWKKTEAQLRQDKEAAERANVQKSEFLARISHELRTPLNAILGFSDVMRSERFGEIENAKYLGYANDIHHSGSHLLSLINDLLDLSKVEAGKLELNFTSVDLRAIIEDCFGLMQEQATAARVVLRKSLQTDLPNVVADFRSIKQIVLNLLSNAIKFTDPGGQVIVSAKVNSSGELVLKVKDTGIGMGPKQLQTAMEPFSRIEAPERKEQTGTGLGLPLTKALTEANRAEFSISSEPRKGTLVEITFPTTRVLAD